MLYSLMSLKNSKNYSVQQDDVRTESVITQVQRPAVSIEMKQYEKKENLVAKDEKIEIDDVAVDADCNTPKPSKSIFQSFFGQLLCCFSAPSNTKPLVPALPPTKKVDNTVVPESKLQIQVAQEQQGKRRSRRHSSKKDDSRKYLLQEPRSDLKGRKTLVLDLDETLVHSSFKPVKDADFIVQVEIEKVIHNVYVCKRPGVDEFLTEVGKHFEVVVFTASLSKYADPVLDYLDTGKVITGRLFREHCTYLQGNYVKDLSRLGRELSQCIIIDNSPCCYQLQPENAMACVSWFDDPSDTQLGEMLPWLYKLAKEQDVFESLEEYKNARGDSHFT